MCGFVSSYEHPAYIGCDILAWFSFFREGTAVDVMCYVKSRSTLHVGDPPDPVSTDPPDYIAL